MECSGAKPLSMLHASDAAQSRAAAGDIDPAAVIHMGQGLVCPQLRGSAGCAKGLLFAWLILLATSGFGLLRLTSKLGAANLRCMGSCMVPHAVCLTVERLSARLSIAWRCACALTCTTL